MKALILRGLPGSGKSTFAARHHPRAVVCSADAWFTGEDGVYRFDPRQLPQAHQACMRRFVEALQAGAAEVVVDNTNTSPVEIAPYVLVGEALGAEVEILTIRAAPKVAYARQTHGVPAEAFAAMVRRLAEGTDAMPRWWRHREVWP